MARWFEKAFGLPAAHRLRQVRRRVSSAREQEWEHEERDASGALVAVYESWTGHDATGCDVLLGFVKYSPSGWVLSGSDARLAARRADACLWLLRNWGPPRGDGGDPSS